MIHPLLPRFALPLVLLGLGACGSRGVPFTLDNPTDQALSLTLDGRPILLAPHCGKDLALKPGRHTLEAPATGSLAFMVFSKTKGGLINPTLSPYVTFNVIYATNRQTAKGFRPMESGIVLDGVPFQGPFHLHQELLIDKDWVFGVHEKLPDQIRVGADRTGNIQGKIYTREDFVAEIEALAGEQGRFVRERRPAPPVPFIARGPQLPPPSGPAEWNAALAPLRGLAERYLKAETASEQEAILKEEFTAVMTLTQYVAKTAHTLGGPENIRRDAEERALLDCFAHSAVLLSK
nr:hypothetical protein [uncultured Holophaga sp.]